LGKASVSPVAVTVRLGMASSHSIDERLIKGLAHPLRWRMLELMTERGESSPVELARLLDQPLATVSHHMRVLRDAKCVELTRTEQRRGAIEHYYQAVVPAFFDDEMWEQVPAVLRRTLSGQTFRRLVDEAAAAGAEGAFDVTGSHLDRMLVELDDVGRTELSELLVDVLRCAQDIQERSDARRRAGAVVRVSELVLLHFEIAESLAARDSDGESVTLPTRSPRVP
jgi:DNA-binding transcriptional ArsR family regulator